MGRELAASPPATDMLLSALATVLLLYWLACGIGVVTPSTVVFTLIPLTLLLTKPTCGGEHAVLLL